MSPINPVYLEHQRKRWMRPDAHRFIRPDWRRFVRPGFEDDHPFALYERKYSQDQPRVPAGSREGGQWTDGEGGDQKPTPNPSADQRVLAAGLPRIPPQRPPTSPRSRLGYDVHHIVEQSSAADAGYPRKMIDGPDNLVSIPRMSHWEINAWYQTRNSDYGDVSPREYLSGKDWDERRRVGLDALAKFGVLKR